MKKNRRKETDLSFSFSSTYSPITFHTIFTVPFRKKYSYTPIVLVTLQQRDPSVPIPRFSIIQWYIDEYGSYKNLFDRFYILLETCDLTRVNLSYQVFDHLECETEHGRIKKESAQAVETSGNQQPSSLLGYTKNPLNTKREC